MIREKAEKIVRGITDKIECNTADIDDWAKFWGFTREEYEEFLEAAIKASEQLNVLDKIRAVIKANRDDWMPWGDTEYHAYDHCLEIIDKYKAESEGRT